MVKYLLTALKLEATKNAASNIGLRYT